MCDSTVGQLLWNHHSVIKQFCTCWAALIGTNTPSLTPLKTHAHIQTEIFPLSSHPSRHMHTCLCHPCISISCLMQHFHLHTVLKSKKPKSLQTNANYRGCHIDWEEKLTTNWALSHEYHQLPCLCSRYACITIGPGTKMCSRMLADPLK